MKKIFVQCLMLMENIVKNSLVRALSWSFEGHSHFGLKLPVEAERERNLGK